MKTLYKSMIKKSWMALVTLTVLSACTEDFNINLDSMQPVFVVDGVITDQPGPHTIRLTTSADYFYNKPCPAVENATVLLSDGISTIQLTEDTARAGYYLTPSDYQGVVGRTYHLSINNVDVNNDGVYEQYEAESEMKPVMPIDSVSMDYNEEQGGKYWQVILYAQDNGARADNYTFRLYKNGKAVTDRLSEISVVNDEFFNGNYAIVDVLWVAEEDEDGNRSDDAPNLNDVYTLEANGVTDQYYDFVYAVQQEMYPKVPIFSGPPANVPSNISNNGFGFFTAYSVVKDSMVVTQDILDKRNK